MRRLLLAVTAIMLVLGAFMTTPQATASVAAAGQDRCSSSSSDDCEELPLSADVSASASATRAYAWSLEKVADATVRSALTDGTATFRYTVTARAGAMTEAAWTMAGQVIVTNPNPDDAIVADVGVTTTVGGGSSCVVSDGDDVVVPSSGLDSGQVALPYTCSFTSAPAGSGAVTATVTWDPAGDEDSATVDATTPFGFTVVSETNKTVAVVDDQTVPGRRVVLDPALTWAPGLVRTYTYDLAVAGGHAPGACATHTNTAIIDQPSGTDPSASATVQACAPEVLPVQAFGRATGSVAATCRGIVRTRVSNRTAETVTYRLRVGDKVRRISVRSLSQKKLVTRGPAGARVTLKMGAVRLDRIRIPQRCQQAPEPPVALPDTGLRTAGS